MIKPYDVLIVGAGFAGSVMAERCAAAGWRVLLLDRRDHFGGNAHDCRDAHGQVIHPYGPHIFHTNSDMVVEYLSRFTQWRPYEHRVLTRVGERLLPMPINRQTLSAIAGKELTSEQAQAYLEAVREPIDPIRNSADVVLNSVGRELYELLFRGYTRKQWGRDPSTLDAQVTARIPVRSDDDDRYFSDRYQQMPRDGYSALFTRMLDHPLITLQLGTEYQAAEHRHLAPQLVWTGPIDRFYDYRFGPLPYRSLHFAHQHLADVDQLQPVAVINEPSEDVPYTRTTEFKHLTAYSGPGTSIVREYPRAEGDPYYPIPCREARECYLQYQALAQAENDVTFIGRLAQYRYYNMDQVVAAALSQSKRLLGISQP